jgi:hypothetical protein
MPNNAAPARGSSNEALAASSIVGAEGKDDSLDGAAVREQFF